MNDPGMTSRVDPQDAMTPQRLRGIADGIDMVLGKLSKWGWDDYMELVRGMDTELLAFADELEARVAVVRPTRDQLANVISEFWGQRVSHTPVDLADALFDAFWPVAVSDSQETPT